MRTEKVDFFTHTPSEIAYEFYRDSLVQAEWVRFIAMIGDAEPTAILLVMQHAEDLSSMRKHKREYPGKKVGVVDPRGAHVLEFLEWIDFFVVDSLEKRDFFLGYGRPVFLYHDVLHLPHRPWRRGSSDRTVLAYHGNRLHLEAMYPVVTSAIERLASERKVEFRAIYNVKHLGKWSWEPKSVEVKHLQWDKEKIPEYLDGVDIGVSPNAMMLANPKAGRRKLAIAPKFFHEKEEDYLIRFKVPTNPGRIYVFANDSIPVVSDICPSAMKWIDPGFSGEIAHHSGAWYHALKTLADSAEIREEYAGKLWARMREPFSPLYQNVKFGEFLSGIVTASSSTAAAVVIPNRELSSGETWKLRLRFFRFRIGARLDGYASRILRRLRG